MKYKHIVFDLDGTLIDNEYAILCSFCSALIKSGIAVEEENLDFILGIPGEVALKQMNIQNVSEVFNLWSKELHESSIPSQLFEGIDELLAELREKGYQLGVVTSKTSDVFEAEEPKYKIDQYFGQLVFADMTEKHKPNADPLEKYMELTGTKAEDILYVGDSVYDMKSAENAKVDFALVHWGSPRKQPMSGYYNLETPNQLLKILKG